MIAVDTSALMAILLDEPEADGCMAAIEAADRLLISAGTVAEALIVAGRRNLGEEMAELIDGLLELSRVSRASLQRARVDVSALALQTIERLREQDPSRAVEVAVQPAITVEGDPRLLRIVIENLLENAWKFTSKTEAPRIEVGAGERDGLTEIFVRDNGAGFDPQYASKLFGAFQRLHSSSEFPGTGIGLATVQRIIARHGGILHAQGAPGRGATFSFTMEGHSS